MTNFEVIYLMIGFANLLIGMLSLIVAIMALFLKK